MSRAPGYALVDFLRFTKLRSLGVKSRKLGGRILACGQWSEVRASWRFEGEKSTNLANLSGKQIDDLIVLSVRFDYVCMRGTCEVGGGNVHIYYILHYHVIAFVTAVSAREYMYILGHDAWFPVPLRPCRFMVTSNVTNARCSLLHVAAKAVKPTNFQGTMSLVIPRNNLRVVLCFERSR